MDIQAIGLQGWRKPYKDRKRSDIRGVLSPTLFIIMFNDLMDLLEQENLEAFAYADDLAIVGVGKRKLNKAIRVVEGWTERNRM